MPEVYMPGTAFCLPSEKSTHDLADFDHALLLVCAGARHAAGCAMLVLACTT